MTTEPVSRRIGLVVLATDHTTERDFGRMLPRDEVQAYIARLEYANPTTSENLRGMQARLAGAAALILPGEPLDVLHFGCTSAVAEIGDEAVEAALQAGKPGTPIVTPLSAARAAFGTLGVKRIGLLTPYTVEVTASMVAYFVGHGFDVRGVTCFGLADDRVIARVRPEAIVAAAAEAITADAEALFVSCTALRAAEVCGAYRGCDRAAGRDQQPGERLVLPSLPGPPARAFRLRSTLGQRLMEQRLTLADVYAARRRIAGRVVRTPLVPSPRLSELAGVDVHLKLEHRQATGSFKLRGATNALLALSDEERSKGVVAASTGNHGRGLAYAARLAGVRCVVCMSRLVPANKLEGIRALGAEIRIVGSSQDDAQAEVDRLVAEEGLAMLPPFDHPGIIAGQATIGLELVEDLPDLASVLVPLSGGGLISGVALAVKTACPQAQVIGVSMERGAAMHSSLQAGRPILVEEVETLADSLGGGIGLANRWTFSMVRGLVDRVVLLKEEEIAAGIRHAYRQEQEIVEGAGAVGIAALLAGKLRPQGPTALVLSGRNIDMALHHRLVAEDTAALAVGEGSRGRWRRRSEVDDRELARLVHDRSRRSRQAVGLPQHPLVAR